MLEQALGTTPATGAPRQVEAIPPLFATPAPSELDRYLTDFDDMLLDDPGRMRGYLDAGRPQAETLLITDATDGPGLQEDESRMPASNSHPRLPPLTQIQPAIDHYFSHVNSLLPLFSQDTFMNMLENYYAGTCQDPQIAWAAVNVVLALSMSLPKSASSDLDLGSGDEQIAPYVNNARSVFPELLTRGVDLLGLQVVLGLVIIYHVLKDSRPAVVLVGTAVRFVHRLRLHTRQGQTRLSSEDCIKSQRVFWITYLFDRDICLRHHTPSVLADGDIDLDLPPETPSDGAGDVYTKDGNTRVNFLRVRLHLAHIQGRIYNLLFATQAAKITSQERLTRIVHLHKQLEHWRLSLPPKFQAETAVDHISRTALYWICMMHFSYLSCLVMIHGIWSHDAEWRKRLRTGLDAGGKDSRVAPKLPRGWKTCVSMSRSCMGLLYRMPLSDGSVW